MKMLHALIGYLVVTTLPLYPFAFAASPLAFNYDGHANKTHIDSALIKQAFDNIVEECQTVTTQSHGDSAFMKHVSSDIIEARQEAPSPNPYLIGLILATVVAGIIWIVEDNTVRGNDVEFL